MSRPPKILGRGGDHPGQGHRSRVEIVPKGLRSFDEHDAEFFLELLPGPRDLDGLPRTSGSGNRKIEQTDPGQTFPVGLIYGPSGCGKSSFVKAGLLPRIDPKRVSYFHLEATPEQTEARLLTGLRKACPELSGDLGLVDSLVSVRRGHVFPIEKKLLIVLDQFEQWLFARAGDGNSELVAALRQCDGRQVQVLVLVRDDFWMAATRLMKDLDLRLVEGENSAAVDLFDLIHARRVLIDFGRAYRVLPGGNSELAPEQEKFIGDAIDGLAQDGRIVSVRLALFADMLKGKPWTPATLDEMGGAAGVGRKFLDDTFGESTAPAAYRPHRAAAQHVLRALLPGTGADLKGQMRSRQELLDISGYANRSAEFDALFRIIDNDLHLITPIDPERLTAEPNAIGSGVRYYQLTHDYLVHSVREWLTAAQRRTRRGRAEILLKERSDLWNSRPRNPHLPSAWEWVKIRALVGRKKWTAPERRMMIRAGRRHGLRVSDWLSCSRSPSGSASRAMARSRAAVLVQELRSATIARVPGIVDRLAAYRRWADPSLRAAIREEPDGTNLKLKLSLALLPVDPTQVDYLYRHLCSAAPGELTVLRMRLKKHQSYLTPRLWKVLDSVPHDDISLLPSASCPGPVRSGQRTLGDAQPEKWPRLWCRSIHVTSASGSKLCGLSIGD